MFFLLPPSSTLSNFFKVLQIQPHVLLVGTSNKHGIVLQCTILHGIVLYSIVLHGIAWYSIACYFIVLNGIKWYYYRVVHLVMLPILISGHFFSLGWGGEGYEQNFLGSKSESCLKVLYLNVSSSFQHWERRNKDMNVKESEQEQFTHLGVSYSQVVNAHTLLKTCSWKLERDLLEIQFDQNFQQKDFLKQFSLHHLYF